MTADEFKAEYARLAHAVQSGVCFSPGYEAPEMKHLRTGLNLVMSDVGSIGRLLVDKGVCSQDEFYTYILAGLQAEVSNYEQELSAQTGKDIHLA